MKNKRFHKKTGNFDKEKTYRFKLLTRIVNILFVSTALLFLFFLLTGGTFALVDSAVSLFLLFILKLSLKKEKYTFSAFFLMTALLITDNFLILMGDGIHDITIMMIPLTILIGGLLIEGPSYWIYVSLLVTTIAAQGILELRGIITNNLSPYTWELDTLILSIFFVLLAIITRYFTDGLYQALNEAHYNARNYRNIFQSTADGIMIHNARDGSLIDANDSALRILGYSPEDMDMLQLSHLCSNEPGYTLSELIDWFRKAGTGEPLLFKWLSRKKDGSPFWLEISMNQRDLNGEKRIISVIRDIDEVIRLELELLQAEKLKAVGQLAGGIAHDFNNQLMVIRGLFEIINEETENTSHREYLEMIGKTIGRSTELVEKMLFFARKGASIRKEPIILQELIRETFYILERSMDKRINLKMELHPRPLIIWGDLNQLQNVLLNLGINAGDAINGRGEILFSCYPDERSTSQPRACLSVKDNGSGIPLNIQDRVFDPFFTTKKEGSGTGLGLSAAYGTIQQHDGEISLISEPGKGTEFLIYLPLYVP